MPTPLGDVLVELCRRRGIPVRTACEKAGLPHDAVRNIRTGRSIHPRTSTLIPLAEVLDVTLDELLAAEGGDLSVLERVPDPDLAPRQPSAPSPPTTAAPPTPILPVPRTDAPPPTTAAPATRALLGTTAAPEAVVRADIVRIHPESAIVGSVSLPGTWFSERGVDPAAVVLVEVPTDALAPDYRRGDVVVVATGETSVDRQGVYLVAHEDGGLELTLLSRSRYGRRASMVLGNSAPDPGDGSRVAGRVVARWLWVG